MATQIAEPLVSIITVNYNNIGLTLDLLASIRQQAYRNIEVWVVDNGSATDPRAAVLAAYPEALYVRLDKNLGFAGGNNVALTQAKGDFIFLVNNDALVTTHCIQDLVTFCQACPNVGAVSPLILFHDEALSEQQPLVQFAGATAINKWTGRNTIIGYKQPLSHIDPNTVETAYTHGAAMMLPRSVVEKVGLMHEEFFLYYEELDWCERIKNNGYTLFVLRKAIVLHRESASVGALSPLKTFYLVRNRLYFMQRYLKRHQLALFYGFYLLISLPKHIVSSLLRGEGHLIRPALKACRVVFEGPYTTYFKT